MNELGHLECCLLGLSTLFSILAICRMLENEFAIVVDQTQECTELRHVLGCWSFHYCFSCVWQMPSAEMWCLNSTAGKRNVHFVRFSRMPASRRLRTLLRVSRCFSSVSPVTRMLSR